MYLSNIHIKNFRGIKELEVYFKPGVNIVIGKNGAGKTSLLEAIRRALGSGISSVRGATFYPIDNSDVNYDMKMAGETTVNVSYNFPVEISSDLEFAGSSHNCLVENENSALGTRLFGDGFSKIMTDLISDPVSRLPLIYYSGSDRILRKPGKRSDDKIVIDTKRTERIDGYDNALSGVVVPDALNKWCLKMGMIQYQENHDVKEFTIFNDIVAGFLEKLERLDSKGKVFFSAKSGELVFRYNGKDMAVSDLSAGYQTLLYMVADLAYRYAVLNPNAENGAAEAEGVVVIDEIDLHLHPEWQWKVVGVLQELFPKVQFIFATHSPLIISSVKDANLIMLMDCSEVIYPESAYGYEIGDVLGLRQQSRELPEEIMEDLNRINAALDADSLEDAEKVLKQIEERYGADSEVSRKARDLYEVNKWIGEDTLYDTD